MGELKCDSVGVGGARLTSLSVAKRGVMVVDWAQEELLLRAEEDKVPFTFLETMIMIGVKNTHLNHKKKPQKNHVNIDAHLECWLTTCNSTMARQCFGSDVSESQLSPCCNNAEGFLCACVATVSKFASSPFINAATCKRIFLVSVKADHECSPHRVTQ